MNRLAGIVAVVAGVSAALGVGAWLIGRVFTDRFLITQFVWWIPAWACLIVIALALLIRTIAQCVLRRSGKRSPMFSRFLTLGLVVAVLHASIFEYRLVSPRTPSPDSSLRLLVWNPAGQPTLAEPLLRGKPDILAVVNSGYGAEWAAVMAGLGERASAVRSGRLVVAARSRVIEWGGTSLKVTGAKERTFKWKGGQKHTIDEGYGIYCVLEDPTPAAPPGTRLTLWFLDLPSDPDIHRSRMMREARAAIDTFRGPRYSRVNGDDRDELIPGGNSPQGFPPADLVVGDFNTPRGSQSLEVVCPGLTHAFRQAGVGPAPTWPRELPLIAIDHIFVAPHRRATKYATLDFGVGHHLAQWCEIVPELPEE